LVVTVRDKSDLVAVDFIADVILRIDVRLSTEQRAERGLRLVEVLDG